MLSDIKIVQCESLFILIDNDLIREDLINKLMYNLFNYEYECYLYIMWLLTRWTIRRKHRFQLPSHKKKDVYCTNCGHSILSTHNYCGNCGTIKYNRYISLDQSIR